MVHSISVQPADYSQFMGQDFANALAGDIPAGVVKLVPRGGAPVDAQKLVLTANKIAVFTAGIGFAVIHIHEEEDTSLPLRFDLVDGPAKFYPPDKLWIPQGKAMMAGVERAVVYAVDGVQESYDAIPVPAAIQSAEGTGEQRHRCRNWVIAAAVFVVALIAIAAMHKLTQGPKVPTLTPEFRAIS